MLYPVRPWIYFILRGYYSSDPLHQVKLPFIVPPGFWIRELLKAPTLSLHAPTFTSWVAWEYVISGRYIEGC